MLKKSLEFIYIETISIQFYMSWQTHIQYRIYIDSSMYAKHISKEA